MRGCEVILFNVATSVKLTLFPNLHQTNVGLNQQKIRTFISENLIDISMDLGASGDPSGAAGARLKCCIIIMDTLTK